MFNESNWIWLNTKNEKNSYVEFIDFFKYDSGNVLLNIAADSKYCAYINGLLVSFGQYSDYPDYKVYNSLDVTQYLKKGENKLAILVWYFGDASMCYKIGQAGLIYEVITEETVLAKSGIDTLSKKAPDYDSRYKNKITPQLGYGFCFDSSKSDGFMTANYKIEGFNGSIIKSNISRNFFERPIENLYLSDRINSKIVQQGEFIYKKGNELSHKMQEAFLSYHKVENTAFPTTIKSTGKKGIYFIIDLNGEESGFLDLEIQVDNECQIDISWGEHLIDGRVRASIGVRNFCVMYKAKSGKQQYLNPLLRFGCRYLQFYVHAPNITIDYAGIRPTNYPVEIKPYIASNILRQTIYDISVKTLRLCMHEYYEDCPWREQCLYNMDSRAQMLFGYYAFCEYKFARASLSLMQYGLRDDGLLDITFPTNFDFPIPSFTFMYPVQVFEYIDYSKDISLAEEIFYVLDSIFSHAIAKIDDNGLISQYPCTSWNFYEWKENYDGKNNYQKGFYDLILNCMLSYSLQHMAKICKILNKDEKQYLVYSDILNCSINTVFFDNITGLYKSFIGQDLYSELGNALAILCGAAKGKEELIAEKLKKEESVMTKTTLSMTIFKYEALRKVNESKYASYILNDIDKTFLFMVRNNATSFWETIKGEEDFSNAGSLCHGWSALPILYYNLLEKKY